MVYKASRSFKNYFECVAEVKTNFKLRNRNISLVSTLRFDLLILESEAVKLPN